MAKSLVTSEGDNIPGDKEKTKYLKVFPALTFDGGGLSCVPVEIPEGPHKKYVGHLMDVDTLWSPMGLKCPTILYVTEKNTDGDCNDLGIMGVFHNFSHQSLL